MASALSSAPAFAFKTNVGRPRVSISRLIQCKESRIGVKAIPVPKGVDVKLDGHNFVVKGPKGELARTLSTLVTVSREENGDIRLVRNVETREAGAQHGLARALLNNMVVGVSTGFTRTLMLVGVGYRAAVSGTKLTLNLGYSKPVELAIPGGVEVSVVKNTTVNIHGYDKEVVGQFAATIRAKRPPEPYKGKGVRYSDEIVRRKEGKKGK
ncbi:MRPL6 [Auxenochlorella protothecoides x Auxenochlorella symbiontica]|uniref:Large ribosomal subunit protein uL6c n=2 Tax=Auxenochlorella protothecoides TaxID=3075 RepID=A0A087S9J7_AUXPR|nr:50S ribosomal protein L6, chloroplastic [Auxenochlorella protothecoides]KFM22401.1 50S ribosomal protein L6, chloroplastic [Auxenochlorella protothecoides]RMZ55650.1 hypothetical protein APUTEX25_000233 [Auxenochlorella protothecoides]|eukprot:RMZ55650.1 hypothetical protein APUTEX25_000233 [Auxenochlorella protothecoides]